MHLLEAILHATPDMIQESHPNFNYPQQPRPLLGSAVGQNAGLCLIDGSVSDMICSIVGKWPAESRRRSRNECGVAGLSGLYSGDK